MIPEFKTLTEQETALLLQAPVIYSAEALSTFENISKTQREDAVKLAHFKTFTEHYQLIPYYDAVNKDFKKHFDAYLEKVSPIDTVHYKMIKDDMDKVNKILAKMNTEYSTMLRKSLEGFARHVKHAAHNVLQDIIFPVTFSKL